MSAAFDLDDFLDRNPATRHFFENEGNPLPIPAELSAEQLLDYWRSQNYLNCRLEVEIELAEEIEKRLQVPGNTSALAALLDKIVCVDAHCRHADSLTVFERIVARLTRRQPPSAIA